MPGKVQKVTITVEPNTETSFDSIQEALLWHMAFIGPVQVEGMLVVTLQPGE